MIIFHWGNPSRSFSLSATRMYSVEFVISNIRYYQLSDPNIIPNNSRPHIFSWNNHAANWYDNSHKMYT